MKKFAILTMALLLTVSMGLISFSTQAQARAKKYHWKISHMRPEGSAIDKDLNWFVEKVREASNGRIDINVYPANQLGDYTVVQERIGVGAVEMACQCLSTSRNKKLQIQYVPYLAKDWNEAKIIFGAGSPLINAIDKMVEKEDIKVISTWPVYFGGIATTTAVTDPEKIHVNKKTKIRVPTIRSFSLLADEWGYQGTPLPWADLFTSMQTGIVDGAIGAGAEGYYANFRDLIKHYYAVNDHFENWYLLMNEDSWKSLSKEDQQIIVKYAQEMQQRRFEVAEEDEENYMKKLSDYGIDVMTFSNEQLDAFAQNSREKIWPQLKKDIGEELIDSSLEALNQ